MHALLRLWAVLCMHRENKELFRHEVNACGWVGKPINCSGGWKSTNKRIIIQILWWWIVLMSMQTWELSSKYKHV